MNATDDISIKQKIELYFDRLWPINRSITGPGIRQSMDILAEIIPIERLRFETGRKVFDWTVPKEWVANDAYFIDPDGIKHACFKENNLHLLGYSIPFEGKVVFSELRDHLYSLPEMPSAIPYVTSYYSENWGFCMSHDELQRLPEGEYQVHIDTELYPGAVEIGEAVLPGETDEEIFFTTYLCHPSLANNELSGPLAMAFLYERIKNMTTRRYTYRFVITSETIGTICYLSERGEHLKNKLAAGYLMTCLGDNGSFTYKASRDGGSLADRAAKIVLRDRVPHTVLPFSGGSGSDEKQYCSPGFNLPLGSLMRSSYGSYEQYHTSLDNKDFVSFGCLAESVDIYFAIVEALEANVIWENTVKYCEPQLGKRNLYHNVSTSKPKEQRINATCWLLNLADGEYDLLAIAERSGHEIELLASIAQDLLAAGLIELSH